MKNTFLPQTLKSKTPKVYKNKKLNTANFVDFTLNDYQVFLHLVSKIGGVDEFGKYLQPQKLQREHMLTAKEFSSIFVVDIHNAYGILKKAIDKLMKTDIVVNDIDSNTVRRVNVCSMAEYQKNLGTIRIEFTDRIMPYLAQVKEKFVLYNLKEIANFGSLYTTRLYELIQEFKETGYMIKSVIQLRESFAVGNKFRAYKDFKVKTFGHACKEINDSYDMCLDFEEVKEGRKVVAIKFFFKSTIVNQVTNKKTGKGTTIYNKPKLTANTRTRMKTNQGEINVEGQLSFIDQKQEAKPVKSILSSILSKFKK